MKLAAATGSSDKLKEFRVVLAPLGIDVISAAEAGFSGDTEENGATFAENAAIKARAVYAATGFPAIADDSGLCVDALGGRPGLYSKRYGGGISCEEQIRLLLKEMENVPAKKRTARFVCALHCVLGENREISRESSCEGAIGFAPAGTGGFGYDPVFFAGDKSFAQLSGEEKNSISHRGKALREIAGLLVRYNLAGYEPEGRGD